MSIKRILFAFGVLICVVLFAQGNIAFALQDDVYELGHGLEYGVDYTECSPEIDARIRDRFEVEILDTMPEMTDGVQAFDVSPSGKIAITTRECSILVIDENGKFQYGYSFEYNSAYGALWAGENIAFMNCRGAAAYILSENGDILATYDIGNDTENNSNYWSEIVDIKTRKVNGYTYKNVCHRNGDTVLDTIVRTDAAGKSEEVFMMMRPYFTRSMQERIIVLTAFVISFASIIIYNKRRENKHLKKAREMYDMQYNIVKKE